MRVISIKKLKEHWGRKGREDSMQALRAWYMEVKKAEWKNSSEIKKNYKNASIINKNIIVFNIKGNKYRLVVSVKYNFSIIYIRFIGTHQEYDKINFENI